jgi:hypothetical protein
MSYVFIHGYGYPKSTCEDVTSWFLNKFFPRHKITIEVVHRGLKRENVRGYCDVVGDYKLPRHFLIELDTHMNRELYIKTLFHELTHMAQWIRGSLRSRYGKLCYCKTPVENWEYWYQPHEIESRKEEIMLYKMYIRCRSDVKDGEVAQPFSNRLMQVL